MLQRLALLLALAATAAGCSMRTGIASDDGSSGDASAESGADGGGLDAGMCTSRTVFQGASHDDAYAACASDPEHCYVCTRHATACQLAYVAIQIDPSCSCSVPGNCMCPADPIPDGGACDGGVYCATNSDCPQGQVCSYEQGCSTHIRRCQDDTSGDAVALPFCGCDGQTFTTNQAHPTQPWGHAGACDADAGSACPADPNTVQSNFACSLPGAVCSGYSPCSETFVQCTCRNGSWDCGDCQIPFDAGDSGGDSGVGPECDGVFCGPNQVCVHTCVAIPRDGGSAPAYCADIPSSCGQGTCDCVRPGVCPNVQGEDAGSSGAPTCSGSGGQLFCSGCA